MKSGASIALGTVAAVTLAGMLNRRGSTSTTRPMVLLDLDETLLRAEPMPSGKGKHKLVEERRLQVGRYVRRTVIERGEKAEFMRRMHARIEAKLAFTRAAREVRFEDGEGYLVLARPGIERELRKLADHADLAVLSAGSKDYVERLLRETGLRALVPFGYSSRDTNDFSWLSGRPWVLVDNLAFGTMGTDDKLRQLMGLGTDAELGGEHEDRVVHVDDFDSYLPDKHPIDGLAEVVLQRLGTVAGSPARAQEPPWLALGLVDRLVPTMKHRGVSKTARSRRGFLTAYREARGRHTQLGKDAGGVAWRDRRNAFVARHMGQVVKRGEPLWENDGSPTRRHLALVAWAYSPEPKRLTDWIAETY